VPALRHSPHPRIPALSATKWTGLALSLLLLAAWLATRRCSVIWDTPGGYRLALCTGRFYFVDSRSTPPPARVTIQSDSRPLEWWFLYDRDPIYFAFACPLWAPTLLTSLATAAAWRRDSLPRRCAAVGLCPTCNYNLAGLPRIAPCPECGVIVQTTRQE